MKFEIKFIDKTVKFEKTLTLDFKDDVEPYKWAEKQIEIWDKSGNYKKVKYTITCLEKPKEKPKPKEEPAKENEMTRKLNGLKKKLKTVK